MLLVLALFVEDVQVQSPRWRFSSLVCVYSCRVSHPLTELCSFCTCTDVAVSLHLHTCCLSIDKLACLGCCGREHCSTDDAHVLLCFTAGLHYCVHHARTIFAWNGRSPGNHTFVELNDFAWWVLDWTKLVANKSSFLKRLSFLFVRLHSPDLFTLLSASPIPWLSRTGWTSLSLLVIKYTYFPPRSFLVLSL
jgi:hypothetical protein